MDLSIVILNYKTKGLLKQCIKGIFLTQPQLKFEIIVVDNGSHDSSVEMVKEEFLQVRIIAKDNNTGYASGINLGIQEAQGKYLLLLNPDIIILEEGTIEKLYQFMVSHPQVGLVGPKLINPDGKIQLSCMKFPSFMIPIYRRTPLGRLPWARKKLREYLMSDWDHNSNREVDWVLGGSMMVRKEALNRVGLMDKRFFLYFDDVDWCRRFWQKGYKVVYFAQVKIVHYHRRESAESPGLKGVFSYITRVHIKSWLRYFNKWKGISLPRK